MNDDAKQLRYRGIKSSVFQLVFFAFVTATLMLVLDKITGSEWVTGALGLVSGYALKESISKMSEAYRDSRQPPSEAP